MFDAFTRLDRATKLAIAIIAVAIAFIIAMAAFSYFAGMWE